MTFVVRYSRSRQELLAIEEHADQTSAFGALRKFEESDDNDDIEVVLLSARSRADLERTHGRYFSRPSLSFQ